MYRDVLLLIFKEIANPFTIRSDIPVVCKLWNDVIKTAPDSFFEYVCKKCFYNTEKNTTTWKEYFYDQTQITSTDNSLLMGSGCSDCQANMAPYRTESGGDIIICPFCDICIFGEDQLWGDYGFEQYCIDNMYSLDICQVCKQIFDRGCIHARNGCTYDINYATIFTKFKLKHQSSWILKSPLFKNVYQLRNIISYIDFHEQCTCVKDGCRYCPRASYTSNSDSCKCK